MFKRFFGGLLILAPIFSYAQNMDYSRIRNGPMVSDGSYLTFAAACSAAGTNHLAVTKTWTNLATQSCGAKLNFTGGVLQPASGQTITLASPITSSLVQIFDTSLNGTIVFARGIVPTAYPQWWGAKGNGTNDDTKAINAALSACNLSCIVNLPAGTYKATGSLNMGGNSQQLCGAGELASIISWQGPTPVAVIQMNGYGARVCNLKIQNDIATGWLDAVSYANGTTTTNGVIDQIFIECNAHPGNGIALGRLGLQGDQALVTKPLVVNCTQGFAIAALNANAVDNVIVNSSLTNNWIGIQAITSVSISVLGGSINDNGLNFSCGFGNFCIIQGVRSENSNRSYFSSVGQYTSPVTFDSYSVNAISTTRVATTTSAANGQCSDLPLNYTDDGTAESKFTVGDFIIIAGAGVAGADLHTQITNSSNPHNMSLSGLLPCAGTPVTNAAVTLDATVEQHNFEEHGGGTYIHRNVVINSPTGGGSFSRDSVQIFDGISFTANYLNPFNLPATATCPSAVALSWKAVVRNASSTHNFIPDYRMNGVNDIISVTAGVGSVNNSLVVASPLWCVPTRYDGLILQINTGAFTLGAGVNDFIQITGDSNNVIRNHSDGGVLTKGYAANSILQVVWSAAQSQWLDLSQ